MNDDNLLSSTVSHTNLDVVAPTLVPKRKPGRPRKNPAPLILNKQSHSGRPKGVTKETMTKRREAEALIRQEQENALIEEAKLEHERLEAIKLARINELSKSAPLPSTDKKHILGDVGHLNESHQNILRTPTDKIDKKFMLRYSGPSEKDIMFMDLMYFGAERETAFRLSRSYHGDDCSRINKIKVFYGNIILQPDSIAYMQLLREGIILPRTDQTDFSDIEYVKDRFSTIKLKYDLECQDPNVLKLIQFFREVIMLRFDKVYRVFDQEETVQAAQLLLHPTGDKELLKKRLWRAINNPSKKLDPALIKQYIELMEMLEDKSNDTNTLRIVFEPLDKATEARKQLNLRNKQKTIDITAEVKELDPTLTPATLQH